MAVGLGGAPICTRLKILTFQTQEGRIWQLFKPGTNSITTDWPFLRVTSHLTHPYSQAHFEWKDLGPGNGSPVFPRARAIQGENTEDKAASSPWFTGICVDEEHPACVAGAE